MTRTDLAKTVFDCSHLTGEFTLRSGVVSNEYFDKYQFESNPEVLTEIARHLIQIIPEGVEMLAGLEMGGLAIATALSMKTGIPTVFVRKKAKEYGTAKLAEGPSVNGKRVLVVEDVITSGGQVVLSTADLRMLGANIDHVICVIDREQGGRESLRMHGLDLLALFTMSELRSAGEES
ncbi:MAG: orotate phosphoribosyltransferase [Ignavibacteria bacterium]|nr:orotate phosphoribosyltransferase [Ignavibacteria bacterium]